MISIEERLPKDGERVLVWDTTTEMHNLARYQGNGWWLLYIGGATVNTGVTHWQELPPPPIPEDADPLAVQLFAGLPPPEGFPRLREGDVIRHEGRLEVWRDGERLFPEEED